MRLFYLNYFADVHHSLGVPGAQPFDGIRGVSEIFTYPCHFFSPI